MEKQPFLLRMHSGEKLGVATNKLVCDFIWAVFYKIKYLLLNKYLKEE